MQGFEGDRLTDPGLTALQDEPEPVFVQHQHLLVFVGVEEDQALDGVRYLATPHPFDLVVGKVYPEIGVILRRPDR